MKKVVLSAVALAALTAPAVAADLAKAPPPAAVAVAPAPLWDVAFGGLVMSDYNFRGITQSNSDPSVGAYFEPQLFTPYGTLYVGIAGYGINWPSSPNFGFTDPSAEIDLYGGWRNTWGAFSLDVGFLYYYYPGEQFNGFTDDSDYWEIYAKASYAVTPALTIGANVFYTDDLLNYSETFAAGGIAADAQAVYFSGTAKWVTPWTWGDLGAFVSGEVGYWAIDDQGWKDSLLSDPSYTYYNVGLAFTYKALTLDLRYHGTDQSFQDCRNFLLIGKGNPAQSWCDDTFVVSLKVDTTLNALK